MDTFLEICNLLKLNEGEDSWNRSNTSKEIKTITKNLHNNKSPGPDELTGGFYQTFRDLLPLILNSFKILKK